MNQYKSPWLINQIVDAIKSVVGSDPIGLHEPRFTGNEWIYVKDCLDSSYVSSVGKYVDRFEADLVKFTGAKYAVAVSSGTAALHVALTLAGVKHEDEVLIPTLTFVATANAVTYCGAIPHMVDSELNHLGLDTYALRDYLKNTTEIRNNQCTNIKSGRVIRAIVPMHTFGHPVDMDGLLNIAHDFHLVIVEDAAESLGSTYKNCHTGTFGLIGAVSFNGNKTITTGGGGAILTNDIEIAKHAKHLTTTAKMPHRWEYTHDEVGYNYRMPNINAALGCAQLEQLPNFLLEKRALYEKYKTAFSNLKNVTLISEPKSCRSNYWLQTLMLDEKVADIRDSVLAATNDENIMTRPVWKLIHKLKPYRNCSRMDLSVAESLERRLINIPSNPVLKGGGGGE